MFSESSDIKRFGIGATMMAACMAMPSTVQAVSYSDLVVLQWTDIGGSAGSFANFGGGLAANTGGVGATLDSAGVVSATGATVYVGRSADVSAVARGQVTLRGPSVQDGVNTTAETTINGKVAMGGVGTAGGTGTADNSRLIRAAGDTGSSDRADQLKITSTLTRSSGATIQNNATGGASTTTLNISGVNTSTTIGTVSPGQNLSTVATAVAGAGTTVINVTDTVGGGGTVKADFIAAGSSAPTISVGRNGYNAIRITGQLTTNLTLTGTRASSYFLVYLDGGMSSAGSITLAGSVATSNVIVVAGAAIAVGSGITTKGNYFLASGTTNTIGGTVDGGIFLANTSTTAAELAFIGRNAVVTSNPWSGIILANAPEPASAALFVAGLAGLGAVTRRRRHKV